MAARRFSAANFPNPTDKLHATHMSNSPLKSSTRAKITTRNRVANHPKGAQKKSVFLLALDLYSNLLPSLVPDWGMTETRRVPSPVPKPFTLSLLGIFGGTCDLSIRCSCFFVGKGRRSRGGAKVEIGCIDFQGKVLPCRLLPPPSFQGGTKPIFQSGTTS